MCASGCQPGWHKSQPLHTETCNLRCTDLLMNHDRTPKTRSIWPTLWVEIGYQIVGVNRHFKPSEPDSPSDACFILSTFFILQGSWNTCCLWIISCQIANSKSTELLSIHANIYLRICSTGSFFLHLLNYSIKDSAECWPHCDVRHCFINSFPVGPNILQTTFLFYVLKVFYCFFS